MVEYNMTEEKYNELMQLKEKFDEAKEFLEDAEGRFCDIESNVSDAQSQVEDAIMTFASIQDALYDTPFAVLHEETEVEKLVKLTGKSISELKSILWDA